MKYIDDAPGNAPGVHYQVALQPNSIFDGISSFYFDDGTHGTINVKYPDVIKGVNGSNACLLYTGYDSTYGDAGVYFQGMFSGGTKEGKLISLGFPFETIYPEETRNELMKKIIFFFGLTTEVNKNELGTVPTQFKLYQNYPNPFNPTTKIRYSIPTVGTSLMKFVQLKIYDILGKEVATLVNQQQQPGNYEVEFTTNVGTNNYSPLPSGVYFYRLQAGNYIQTKKMMLLK